MDRRKILSVSLMIGICVAMWVMFFSMGIKTIGAVLFPVIVCLVCLGTGIAYEKLINKTGT